MSPLEIIKKFRESMGICDHHWVIIKNIDSYDNPSDKLPYQRRVVLQCDKCGNIKSKYI